MQNFQHLKEGGALDFLRLLFIQLATRYPHHPLAIRSYPLLALARLLPLRDEVQAASVRGGVPTHPGCWWWCGEAQHPACSAGHGVCPPGARTDME